MDARTDAFALPYHEGSDKFGLIPPSGLRGDIMTDKWTNDRHTDEWTEKITLLSHTLTMRGSDSACLI